MIDRDQKRDSERPRIREECRGKKKIKWEVSHGEKVKDKHIELKGKQKRGRGEGRGGRGGVSRYYYR